MIDDNYDPYRWTAGLVAGIAILIIIAISLLHLIKYFL